MWCRETPSGGGCSVQLNYTQHAWEGRCGARGSSHSAPTRSGGLLGGGVRARPGGLTGCTLATDRLALVALAGPERDDDASGDLLVAGDALRRNAHADVELLRGGPKLPRDTVDDGRVVAHVQVVPGALFGRRNGVVDGVVRRADARSGDGPSGGQDHDVTDVHLVSLGLVGGDGLFRGRLGDVATLAGRVRGGLVALRDAARAPAVLTTHDCWLPLCVLLMFGGSGNPNRTRSEN